MIGGCSAHSVARAPAPTSPLVQDFGIDITRASRGCSEPCSCRHNISPLQLIFERYSNSKRHFLMNMGQISLGPLAKATSCVVSDSELLAP